MPEATEAIQETQEKSINLQTKLAVETDNFVKVQKES